jgi:lysyl-tRNA synthetase class 2
MSRIDETIQAKIEKRRQLEAAGVVIHPYSFEKTHTVAEARESEGKNVQTAGRIMAWRAHGKVVFADLVDQSGKIQVLLHASALTPEAFAQLSFIDPGDFMAVTGMVTVTRTGELTIQASEYQFMGKTLRPIPTAWNQAEDKEVRFRRRYLDMLINADTRKVLDARWLIEKEIRRYLQDQHNFTEVETPVLQALYGGTNAKPFTTHMNALDTDYYLRLAPELYLKRLIVGGYERIFEIARNFRNEGIDQTHQPEFTMIEWYEAYADYHRMMDVAEGLVRHLVQKLHGTTKMLVKDHEIDVGGKWPRLTMTAALLEHVGIDVEKTDDDGLKALLVKHTLKPIGEFSRGKAIFSLFDHLVPEHLIQPTWIIDYPKEVSPLAKQHRLNPDLVERFEGYIAGKEIGDGWSEITDALDQRSRFENEQLRMRQGDAEAHPVDEDFLEAMEHGMPPLGGIGIGIDRLVMFLTNTWSIREVIAFPTLRPVKAQAATPAVVGDAPAQKTDAPKTTAPKVAPGGSLPPRAQSEALLDQYVKNDKLAHHCRMVATALEAYAKVLGEDAELWYQTGLLHDVDWEAFPDEHPNKAVAEFLTEYPAELRQAILAHAPERTNAVAETMLDRYLFACDELSGLMHAASLMRPTRFTDMEVKSVKKKLKDKSFAANVSREDIENGMTMIGKNPDDHIAFLINVFQAMPATT